MADDEVAELLARLNLTANLWLNGLLPGATRKGAQPLQIWIGTVGFVANDRLLAIGHRNSSGSEFWLLSDTLDSSASMNVHRLKQNNALTQAQFMGKAVAYFDCFFDHCSEARPALTPHVHLWSQKPGVAAEPSPSCSAPAGWTQIWGNYCA